MPGPYQQPDASGVGFAKTGTPVGTGVGFVNPISGVRFDPTTATVFSPNSISGITAWWDFTDATTLYTDAGTTLVSADADLIYQANDKSTNHNNLIQATSGNRPQYKLALLNSLSGAVFAGSGDTMQTAAFGAALAQPYTTAHVLKLDGTGLGQSVQDGITSGHRSTLLMWFDSNYNMDASAGPQTTSVSMSQTGFHYIVATWSRTNTIFRYDGTNHAVADIGAHTLDGISLAAAYDGSGSEAIKLCESIVVAGALSAPDLASLETYLTTKYAL